MQNEREAIQQDMISKLRGWTVRIRLRPDHLKGTTDDR